MISHAALRSVEALHCLASSASQFRYSSFKMTTMFDYLTMHDKNISTLRVGTPSVELLARCGELIQKAAQELHRRENYANMFQYGPHSGTLVFKSELAKFLTEQYGGPVDRDDIWINAGATQGFQWIGSLLFQPGDIAFVEEPTYFIGLTVLRDDLGMNVIGVPTDQDGMIVDEFEKLLSQHCHQMRSPTERKPFSGLLYCIPTFNNPTGSVLPVERCKKLIKLLRKYNMLAFCDDVYNLLSYMGDKPPFTTPPRLCSFDEKTDPDYKGSVVSNTFEKYNVDFNKGSGFSSTGQFKNCMRLCFSFHIGPVIEHCVKQIALAIKEILGGK